MKQKMVIEFEWDETLGKDWFNLFSLELCLFGKEHTEKHLLSVTQIINNGKKEVNNEKAENDKKTFEYFKTATKEMGNSGVILLEVMTELFGEEEVEKRLSNKKTAGNAFSKEEYIKSIKKLKNDINNWQQKEEKKRNE